MKDGPLRVTRQYYYRNGMDAEKFEAGIKKRLEAIGVAFKEISSGDRWAPWPRDSFFWAEVKF
jgi:hypothetical protein